MELIVIKTFLECIIDQLYLQSAVDVEHFYDH